MKKNYDFIWINLLTLVLGIIAFYSFDKKFEVFYAILATGISISIGYRHYKIENYKLFKELFTEFNEKYDTKFNNELSKIHNQYMVNPNYQLTENDNQLVIDYINLCAEEYLWYTKGRIDESVWKNWENGMKFYLNIEPIKKCFINEESQKDSYYGLFSRLNIT